MEVKEPQFPSVLSSTLLSSYKSCPRKFFLEHCMNWKPKDPSVHLHAGACFAKALEVSRTAFYTGVEQMPVFADPVPLPGEEYASGPKKLEWHTRPCKEGDAPMATAMGLRALLAAYGDFECPPTSAKSAERMAGALEFYFDNYPLGADGAEPITLAGGKRGIEISFAEPMELADGSLLLHPETGDPLLMAGRLDMAATYAQGLFIEDDKTTSSLGATWSQQWDLRSQFTSYCWGLKKSASIKPQGVLVRGVSILKTKYDTQQAITYRPDWMIDEWYRATIETVQEMLQRWNSGYWRPVFDHACAEYGGCAFRRPCLSDNPQPWLEQYFVQREWNTLNRDAVVVAYDAG